TFNQGEQLFYLAKLEQINAPHRLKLNFQHHNGWGWDEVWNWDDPGQGWAYTFFRSSITNPEPETWTFTLYITLDDVNWTQLSQIQATVLGNGTTYSYINTQTCENVVDNGSPTWTYSPINPKTTF